MAVIDNPRRRHIYNVLIQRQLDYACIERHQNLTKKLKDKLQVTQKNASDLLKTKLYGT